jgi:phosphatidylserine/phosphatidylglycerophosphate/cardiolipin synthase-like enzyme
MDPTPHRADAFRLPSCWRVAAMILIAAWTTGCASLPANTGRAVSNAFNAPDATPLGQLVQARRTQAGARSDSGFYLLDSVDSAFTSRLALIEGAQRSLDLQYYAIHADASTEILLQRLRDAARRGVKVRLLLDDFNTVGQDAQVLLLQFEPNVEIRLFNPLTGSRSSLISRVLGSLHDAGRIQKRMHNKLFLADNALGITGGRNLGDAYFGTAEKSNFVDLDVLAWGRVVRDMSASFDRYWNDELAYPVQTLLSREDLEMLRKKASEQAPAATDPSRVGVPQQAAAAPASVPATASTTVLPDVTMTTALAQERAPMDLRRVPLTWAPSRLMVDKPDKIGPEEDETDASDTVVDGLLALMLQARQDILIISPYFVPGAEMMKTFAQARARGVRIRVLTNSLASNDAPAAHAGYARYRRDLLGMGIELHEMRATEQTGGGLAGSGRGGSGGRGLWLGSSGGGSKSGSSRASLHSKAVIIDGRLAIIGSMNLDLRSKNLNSEVALLIRSAALSREATRLVESTFAQGAYRVELADGKLFWRAPPGAGYPDATDEPEAGTRLKLLVKVLGPLAPDEML